MSSKHQKVVIRHLPPDLPEGVFWKSIEPLIANNSADAWRLYCPGKQRQDSSKDNVQSRAYIEFTDDQVLINFSKAFDGHVFVDKKGNRAQARVELAPFQRTPLPPSKRKADPRQGSIEDDPDYLTFVENLSKPAEATSAPEVVSASKMTPLLEHLRKQKEGKAAKSAEKGGAAKGAAKASKPAAPTSKAESAAKVEASDAAKESQSKNKRRRGAANKAKEESEPVASTSAPTQNDVKPVTDSPKKTHRPPRQPRQEGAEDVSRRLMGGVLGAGGGRLAARRAEEKAAKEQAVQDRQPVSTEQSIAAPPTRGRGRGRGRGQPG